MNAEPFLPYILCLVLHYDAGAHSHLSSMKSIRDSVFSDVGLLRIAPPRKGSFESLGEYAYGFTWRIGLASQMNIRESLLAADGKQWNDAQYRVLMKARDITRIEWYEAMDVPQEDPACNPLKRPSSIAANAITALAHDGQSDSTAPPPKRFRAVTTPASPPPSAQMHPRPAVVLVPRIVTKKPNLTEGPPPRGPPTPITPRRPPVVVPTPVSAASRPQVLRSSVIGRTWAPPTCTPESAAAGGRTPFVPRNENIAPTLAVASPAAKIKTVKKPFATPLASGSATPSSSPTVATPPVVPTQHDKPPLHADAASTADEVSVLRAALQNAHEYTRSLRAAVGAANDARLIAELERDKAQVKHSVMLEYLQTLAPAEDDARLRKLEERAESVEREKRVLEETLEAMKMEAMDPVVLPVLLKVMTELTRRRV